MLRAHLERHLRLPHCRKMPRGRDGSLDAALHQTLDALVARTSGLMLETPPGTQAEKYRALQVPRTWGRILPVGLELRIAARAAADEQKIRTCFFS